MEPVTVQNEFAVERPHRKHPVRGHRAGEAGSISRNLRTCESETSDGRNLDLIDIRVGISAVEAEAYSCDRAHYRFNFDPLYGHVGGVDADRLSRREAWRGVRNSSSTEIDELQSALDRKRVLT